MVTNLSISAARFYNDTKMYFAANLMLLGAWFSLRRTMRCKVRNPPYPSLGSLQSKIVALILKNRYFIK
ncbi:hypothetical protein BJX66DRAFT_56902 [Aspergillus keveii]|uniref:Uncharacterized protein n=1 Tax=Aspergillus keveii TaxID=714993 RepID=A0ABR4GGV6_9EURO